MKKLIYICFLLVLYSCASSKKEAIALSEKGLHESAVSKWQDALKEDPNDAEIIAGLRKSQDAVCNNKLIKIRDDRLAKNFDSSLSELKSLVDLQKQWGLSTNFNSATFQGNEVNHLSEYYKNNIKSLVENKKTLAAEIKFKKFELVFSSENEMANLHKLIFDHGKKECDYLIKTKGKAFFMSFVAQYCSYFDRNRKTNLGTVSQAKELFMGIDSEIMIDGIAPEITKSLASKLSKNFAASTLYSANSSKMIKLKIQGKYTSKLKKEKINQAHQYTVKVPYEVYEDVTETKLLPVTEHKCDSSGQNCNDVTSFQEKSVVVNKKVTKYRDEARVYSYEAMKSDQEYNLQYNGSMKVENNNFSVSFNKTEKEEIIEHDILIPEIGLNPMKGTITDPAAKFEVFSEMVGSTLISDLKIHWSNVFCTLPSTRTMSAIGENVLKCKIANINKDFVDKWFENNFGAKTDEIETLIGKF